MTRAMDRLRHALEWPVDGDDAVGVVGVGALGTEVVDLLVHTGVRRIHIVDPDRVSESTVAHTLAARIADIGRFKVDSVVSLYEQRDAPTRIAPWAMSFEVFPEAVLRECSIVLGCVDSLRSRLRIGRACVVSGVPYLDGGLSDWGAGVSLFTPALDGPCFRCVVSDTEIADEAARHACSGDQNPAAATLSVQSTSAITAGIMVQEALKLRAASPDAMKGGEHVSYSVRDVRLLRSWSAPDPNCGLPHRPISVVDVETAATSPREVIAGIASELGVAGDLAVLWPGAWAYCQDCAFEEESVRVSYDAARSIAVLRSSACRHDRTVPLESIAGLPAWPATARPALDGRRLSVIARDGALEQQVILRISDRSSS